MSLITSILRGGTNSHQTTSEEANAVYTDFVSEGVVGSLGNTSGVAPATGGFAVNAQGTPDMTVAVTSGVAYVTGTPSSQNSQTFRVINTASANVTISANSSGSTKYDWVYIALNATNLNNPNSAGDNVATLTTSRSSSAASDDGTPPTYGFPLAVVTVANGASSITNGNIRDVRTGVALNTGTSNSSTGWVALTGSLTTATGYNKGNKEYDITSSTDLSSVLSKGMRLKVTRATTPPTQCADLELSSSQYGSKTSPTGISFTDDPTAEAWIKLESYGTVMSILSRYNGTSGWQFRLSTTGQLEIYGYNAGGTNFRGYQSYQSVPLDVWVHVAATLDMSGSTGTLYINGVSVPGTVSQGGTNPTALIQAGNLELGASNTGTTLFDGKLSDVRLWSATRTATQIRDNMNQQLVGNETNLVGYWKLDGNLNDSTSNANNFTGSGGAVATNSDNPMNATEYAIVTNVTSTTVTVFTGTDYNIPNLTLSTPYYSTHKTPYGFPSSATKWLVETLNRNNVSQGSAGEGTWYNLGSEQLSIPTGQWLAGYEVTLQHSATSGDRGVKSTLSTGSSSESSREFTVYGEQNATSIFAVPAAKNGALNLTAQTIYYLNTAGVAVSTSTVLNRGDVATTKIFAECAYV